MGVKILPDRVEVDPYEPLQDMIPDGFGMNCHIRALPKMYRPAAVANMGWIRKAAGQYYPKMYATPTDPLANPVPLRGAYDQQHRMVPGSYIWGWDLRLITVQDVVIPATDLFVNIVDPCLRRSIFQTWVSANMLRTSVAFRRPFVLNHPYEVTTQGLIDVQFRNNSDNNAYIQLVLFTAAPSIATAQMGPTPGRGTIAISRPVAQGR